MTKGTMMVSRLVLKQSASTIWNEDMVIALSCMRQNSSAHTITYTEVEHLSRESLESVMENFRDEKKEVRKMTLWLTLQRGMVFSYCHSGMLPYQWDEYLRTIGSPSQKRRKILDFGAPKAASGVSENLTSVLSSIQKQLATLQVRIYIVRLAEYLVTTSTICNHTYCRRTFPRSKLKSI